MSATPNNTIRDPQVSGGAEVARPQQPSAVVMEAEPSAPSDDIMTSNSGGVTVEYLPDHAYHITLGLFCRNGTIITKVVDSRSADIEQAWKELGLTSNRDEEVVHRLVMAEDLPKETEELMECVFQVDRRLLADHAASKGHTVLGQEDKRLQFRKTEFHVNDSELPMALSVALPFEIQATPASPANAPTRPVDTGLASATLGRMGSAMDRMEKQPCTLSTSWLRVSHPYSNIERLLWVTYKRISFQFVPTLSQQSPLCVLLMYPPISKLEAQDVIFHTSDDMKYPPADSPANSTPIQRLGHTEILLASEKIVQYLASQLRLLDTHTSKDLKRVFCKWMALNTQATFRESINSSVDYWSYISTLGQEGPRNIEELLRGSKDLLSRFREATTIKLRQLERARTEFNVFTKFGDLDINTIVHITQAWSRLENSLDPLLANMEKLLQTKTANLQSTMTSILFENSRTTIQQAETAETVKRLTKLAFIFIPISAICSAFGMNVKELAHSQPPVWVPILVMLGITTTTILLSLETANDIMQDIIWAMRYISGPLMFRYTFSTVWRTVRRALATEKDKLSRLPLHSTAKFRSGPSWKRWLCNISKLLLSLCRLPWVVVERLARSGKEQAERREDRRFSNYGKEDNEVKASNETWH